MRSEIGRAVAEVGEFFDYLTIALLPVLLRTPLPRVRRFRRGIDELEREQRRGSSPRAGAIRPRPNGDLLSILLAARDVEGDGTGMSDEQVRDEAVTLITAGHETTANGLKWTWYLLSHHPEVEERLHAELASVLGGRAPTGRPTPRRCAYTEAVLLEAMRLYPPAWGIERRAVRDQEIGGYVIPAGAAVLMPTFVINRDPRLYPDPLRFDPERFLGEAAAARPDWAYPLFGARDAQVHRRRLRDARGGARGRGAGRRFRLRLDADRRPVPQARVSLRPRDGLWMRPELRTLSERGSGAGPGLRRRVRRVADLGGGGGARSSSPTRGCRRATSTTSPAAGRPPAARRACWCWSAGRSRSRRSR